MNEFTLARLRPQNRSSSAVEDALAALQAERGRCIQRVAIARQDRAGALLRASTGGVDQADKALRDAERDGEMLDALESALQVQLTEARQVERRRDAAIQDAVTQAEAAVAAFTAKAPRYNKLAAELAEIGRLEQAAASAIYQAQSLSRGSGMPLAQFGERPTVRIGPQNGAALSEVLVLPQLDGPPGVMHFGALPEKHLVRSPYAHPDARQVY